MAEMWRQTQISIAAATSSMFPGFRFSPSDQELISYYLKKKLEGSDECVEVISEVEICKYDPWDLPAKSVIPSENEWFFFSPRGRKYPSGLQSKRSTESGYWKATGKERNVKSGSHLIGTKRTLVFHTGRAPKGERTQWIMHEYCISGRSQDSLVVCRLGKNSEFRLNDSPRQGSLSQTYLSTDKNSSGGLSEEVEQSGIFEGPKGVECCSKRVECCSKEFSCNYNFHSVDEQIDFGSESDRRPINEFSQPGSSHQVCDDEECYAEILKDDIIDLNKSLLPSAPDLSKSSLPSAPDLLPMVSKKFEYEKTSQRPVQAIPLHVLPLQGTANRRIRLRMLKPEKYNEPPKVEISSKNYFGEKSICSISKQSPKCLLGFLWDQRVNRPSISIILIILTPFILFLSLSLFLLAPWQVK